MGPELNEFVCGDPRVHIIITLKIYTYIIYNYMYNDVKYIDSVYGISILYSRYVQKSKNNLNETTPIINLLKLK